MAMVTVNEDKENPQIETEHTERIQAHKGEPRRTSKRWLVETPSRVQYSGGRNKRSLSRQHYYNISLPKNYAKQFKLGKGDLFMWSLIRETPTLEFKLTRVNIEGANV